MLLKEINTQKLDPISSEWFSRSEYWRHFRPIKRGQPKKFKYREPLILCGHGARLNIDPWSILIPDGFTHYPQKPKIIRLFPGDPNLPDRIVMLDGSGGISFDALKWMIEQEITFIQLNWRGEGIEYDHISFSHRLRMMAISRSLQLAHTKKRIGSKVSISKLMNSYLVDIALGR